ncbi:hypothetical protein [Streptomyces sp. NBC_00212]|uniref:hypothetical protein n=1 Tax=Streptomyces sp. NBC_00212 TaxID=2975684 RepID=UPI003243B309
MVESAFYADIALSVYMKVKALGQRPEGCTAGAATLASYLGMSTSSVERGLAQLRSPRPDGRTELAENTRRSLPGGTGTTARRRVRSMTPTERFVWLPIAACEDLTPRQLRTYAVLVFTQAQRIPLALSELAGFLRHHSGKRAGQPITATAAASVVDELEASGWVTVQRRAGRQGRNHYLAHDIPRSTSSHTSGQALSSATGPPDHSLPAEAETQQFPAVGEGSGSPVHAGSLVTKEDHKIARPEYEPRLFSPAVGETQVVKAAGAVENLGSLRARNLPEGLALRADDNSSPSSSRYPKTNRRGGGERPYNGPQLTLSPQIYAVLEPVHWLLQRVDSPYVVRRIAQEVGRQLREGMEPERLRHRLTVRFARVFPSDIRDPGRWILGVALPRWGCGHLDCETGVMWSNGSACAVCEEVVADIHAVRRRRQGHFDPLGGHPSSADEAPARPDVDGPAVTSSRGAMPQGPSRDNCHECGCRILLTGKALLHRLCKPCREEQMQVHEEAGDMTSEPRHTVLCTAWDGVPCSRNALPTRTVCARHRALEVANERQVC